MKKLITVIAVALISIGLNAQSISNGIAYGKAGKQIGTVQEASNGSNFIQLNFNISKRDTKKIANKIGMPIRLSNADSYDANAHYNYYLAERKHHRVVAGTNYALTGVTALVMPIAWTAPLTVGIVHSVKASRAKREMRLAQNNSAISSN